MSIFPVYKSRIDWQEVYGHYAGARPNDRRRQRADGEPGRDRPLSISEAISVAVDAGRDLCRDRRSGREGSKGNILVFRRGDTGNFKNGISAVAESRPKAKIRSLTAAPEIDWESVNKRLKRRCCVDCPFSGSPSLCSRDCSNKSKGMARQVLTVAVAACLLAALLLPMCVKGQGCLNPMMIEIRQLAQLNIEKVCT